MRWRRRSKVFFAVGGVLILAALGLIASLCMMNLHAHVSPDPHGTASLSVTDASEEKAFRDFVEVDWGYWNAINPDIIAWVNVPNTKINYPIMRASADDPTYYLHHDIYRNYSVYGVPYRDSDHASTGEPLFNAIIYGHHMDDGSMFSDFAAYSDEGYARDHATICLQTPAGKQRLKVAFVSIIDGDTTPKSIQFANEDAFHDWYQEQTAAAEVVVAAKEENAGIAPPYVVTFCTCSYHRFSNERTLVVCIPDDS